MVDEVRQTEVLAVDWFNGDGWSKLNWVEIPGSNGTQWQMATSYGPLPHNMVARLDSIDEQIRVLSALRDHLPSYSPPVQITRWVTCHTAGCVNDGVTIEVHTMSNTSGFWCGGCSTEITDVSDVPPEVVPA